MKHDRRAVLRGMGTVGIAGMAGCLVEDGGGDDENGDGTPEPDPTNVGMVYALGGLGDQSFNDMAHEGIKQAKQDMNVEFQNAEPERDEDFGTLQQQFASSSNPDYDLVCCIGFAQTSALVENAPQFSDQNFMLVDSVAETEDGEMIDNVANYLFQEPEGSFQVGHLAGQLTTRNFDAGAGSTNDDKVVGFVGGLEIDLIKGFEAGYRAGVAHADDSIEVRSAYAGSWSDPSTGNEIAVSMIDEGADVIYHAAGGTGVGVFRAAQDEGVYAIGVDADQSRSASEYSDVIVASMVKHVDTAVYTSVENVVNDNHQGGTTTSLGLEQDGVEAVIGQDFEGEIPDDVTSALEDSRQAIIDGDIEVPQHPDDL
ncbi:BMP family ABC transporter substrate-binding protein [Halobacteriales archaeon QS_1_68_20]|nr:MAG: BMP family ABC transporter substrate-binding protein [Halobacteriales archaeon QS_1_68_20]